VVDIGEAAGLRALLEHMLPILMRLNHTGGHAPTVEASGAAETKRSWLTIGLESLLVLLQASARVLANCVQVATASERAYSRLAQGWQQGSFPAPCGMQAEPAEVPAKQKLNDLVTALDAVLSLSAALVSGGPLWHEARAHHPLLLIDTLHSTVIVSGFQ
jgi:hypothetical protein